MNNLLLYLAQSSTCLLGFYLFYYFLLKKETGFQFNRVYLLATPLLSFLIPLLKIPLQIFSAPLQPIYEGTIDFTVVANPSVITVQPAEAPFDWMLVIWGIYGLGLAYFAIRFAQQFLIIKKFIRQNPPEITSPGTIKVIYTAGHFPTFSFLNYLFWDNTQNLTETEKQKIWQHESVHIYQKHTWDILYLEVLGILFWFNPLVFLYKKALASTHEFIADAVVIRETNQQDYTSLLVKQVINQGDLSLGHFFSKSLTLKRMKMLQKNNLRPNRVKQLMALPLLGLLLLLFSFNNASVADMIDNPAAMVSSDNFIYGNEADENGIIAPQFPGGEAELNKFLRRNIKYPAQALKNNLIGDINFTLRIEKDGNVKLNIPETGNPFATEIERLVSSMPKWTPATRNGAPLAVDYVFLFQFRLNPNSGVITYNQPKSAAGTLPAFYAAPVTIVGYGKESNLAKQETSLINRKDNIDKLPQFPGGKTEYQKFLSSHTQYPATALKNKISGQAIMQATIDADGKITNFKTLHTDNILFEQEAVSVLREMPRWEPALKDGKAVSYNLVFPFVFALESKQNIPAMRLPANRSQLYVQDAIVITGYSQIIPGKTFVKKENLPSRPNTNPQTPVQDDEKVFTFVEQMAAFPGGEIALNNFIRNNLKYPAEALRNGVSGLVVAQFTVDKTGKIRDPQVVKSLGAGTDEEALRVIKLMPDFTPARQNGKPVNFRYTIPIRFGLTAATPRTGNGAAPAPTMPDKVFTFVEMQPQFPGGMTALNEFIKKNLRYPAEAIARKVEGLVVIQFVVDTTGQVIEPKIVKPIGHGLDEEALRVVKAMPEFQPARQNNHKVAFRYTMPFRFALPTETAPTETVK